jgi:hypothetical protein
MTWCDITLFVIWILSFGFSQFEKMISLLNICCPQSLPN